MSATLQEIAGLIRTLPPEERERLADDLGRVEGAAPRCPSVDYETKAQCELTQKHPGAHTAVARVEWLVALRCRIGAGDGAAVCDFIDGHEGPCIPRPAIEPPPPLQVRVAKPWGICPCGAARKVHELRGHGGYAATGCEKYGRTKR